MIPNLRPLECEYGIRMKESAKSDCRFGFLVENRYRRHTPDVSDVSDVSDVTRYERYRRYRRYKRDVTYVSDVTYPISPLAKNLIRNPNLPSDLHDSFILIVHSQHASLA